MAKMNLYMYNGNASVSFDAKFQKVGKRKPLIGEPRSKFVRIEFTFTLNDDFTEVNFDFDAVEAFFINPDYEVDGWKLVEDLSNYRDHFYKQVEERSELLKKNAKFNKEREERLAAYKREQERYERLMAEGAERIEEVSNIIKKDFGREIWQPEVKVKIANGEMFSVPNGGVNLGRCYNKYSYLVFLNGNEMDKETIPSGNGGNYSITGEGEHPVLGKYLETTCCVDSGD
jgi:hypothetical protein